MTPERKNEPPPDAVTDGSGGKPPRPDADPERTCIATGAKQPQSRMVRFARSPDGLAVPDVAERLPGRGVWVSATRAAVETATRKGGFSRGFKAPTQAPEGLAELVESLLLKRCQEMLGLARRSGQIVLGADQVAEEIRRRPPGWLIEAADGAADGRSKLIRLAEGLYGEVRIAGALNAQELGMAFGREHVVHALMKRGRFAKLWSRAYARLCGFRDRPEDGWILERDR